MGELLGGASLFEIADAGELVRAVLMASRDLLNGEAVPLELAVLVALRASVSCRKGLALLLCSLDWTILSLVRRSIACDLRL